MTHQTSNETASASQNRAENRYAKIAETDAVVLMTGPDGVTAHSKLPDVAHLAGGRPSRMSREQYDRMQRRRSAGLPQLASDVKAMLNL